MHAVEGHGSIVKIDGAAQIEMSNAGLRRERLQEHRFERALLLDVLIRQVGLGHDQHVHMLIEAENKQVLARGLQGFQISAARNINTLLGVDRYRRRRGPVFEDRYQPSRGNHVAHAGATCAVVYLEQLEKAPRRSARTGEDVAGGSVLERDLVPGLEGARGEGLHVADARNVRSAHGSQTAELVTSGRLEVVWLDIGARCAEPPGAIASGLVAVGPRYGRRARGRWGRRAPGAPTAAAHERRGRWDGNCRATWRWNESMRSSHA